MDEGEAFGDVSDESEKDDTNCSDDSGPGVLLSVVEMCKLRMNRLSIKCSDRAFRTFLYVSFCSFQH